MTADKPDEGENARVRGRWLDLYPATLSLYGDTDEGARMCAEVGSDGWEVVGGGLTGGPETGTAGQLAAEAVLAEWGVSFWLSGGER